MCQLSFLTWTRTTLTPPMAVCCYDSKSEIISRSLVEASTPLPTTLEQSACFASLWSLLASRTQLTSVLWLQLTLYVRPLVRHSLNKPWIHSLYLNLWEECRIKKDWCKPWLDLHLGFFLFIYAYAFFVCVAWGWISEVTCMFTCLGVLLKLWEITLKFASVGFSLYFCLFFCDFIFLTPKVNHEIIGKNMLVV